MAITIQNTAFKFQIAAIDDQHQQLIDLIVRLDESVGGALPDIFGVLDELQKYVRDHFAFEEEMLLKHAFPEYESHKHEHEVFEAYVRHLNRRIHLGKAELQHDVLAFLKLWLTRHIQGSDRKYAEFLKQRGVVL
jgi:hemerythrin